MGFGTATRDISKPTFGRAPASFSYFSSVTVVKVLHFIDGVKWYVGRFKGQLCKASSREVLPQPAGTSFPTWTLTGGLSAASLLLHGHSWYMHANVEITRGRIFMLTGPE